MFDKLFDNICNTKLWDPELMWNTTTPRMSTCMADTLCVWLPAACLTICLTNIFIDIYRSVRPTISNNYYNCTRLAISCLLTMVTVGNLAFSLYRRYYDHHHQWPADTSSPSTVAYIIRTVIEMSIRLTLTLVVYLYRLYGIHNCSGCLWFYLLADTVAGGLAVWAYVRTPATVELIFISIEFSLTILLLVFCSFADRLPTQTTTTNCPKDRASYPSLLTFSWVDRLLWTGWRKPLTLANLWPLRSDDSVDTLMANFRRYYKTGGQKTGWLSTKLSKWTNLGYIYRKWFKTDNVELVNNIDDEDDDNESTVPQLTPPLTPAPSNVFTAIVKTFWWTYLTPTLIYVVLDAAVIVSAYLLKFLIEFTINDEPQWHGYVYATTLLALNMIVAFAFSTNIQKMQVLGQRIKTLLTALVYRKALVLSNSAKNQESNTGQIVNLMAVDCHRFIAMGQIVLALYLLYNELGVSTFAGLAVMLAIMLVNAFVAKINDNITGKQMSLKDQRQLISNDVFNGIKVLKLYGWEKAFVDKILQIRSKELRFLRTAGFWSTITVLTSNCLPFMVALATFGTYLAIGSEPLDAQKVFVSLTLLANVGAPLMQMPDTINEIILLIVSTKRLNKFLDLPEITNYVTHDNELPVLRIENGCFTWNSGPVVNNHKVILKDINLKIMDGMFVAVIGTVGSAKSSLLAALLGEMDRLSGRVNIRHGISVAYVPQQPWIMNMTLKDNILFGKDINEDMYKMVINSCALSDDLRQLSAGDETEIGEKGINLSGGQKQRVSLARAVYSEADLYLLDDPLSAVDSHVGQHIMHEVLHSETGLLRNKTRIMVTNQLFVLPFVDQIVVLKNGKIQAIGSYDQLMNENKEFSQICRQYSGTDNMDNKFNNNTNNTNNDNNNDNNNIITVLSSDEVNDNRLIDDENVETGQIKLRIYLKYIKSMSIVWTIMLTISYVLAIGSESAATFWLSLWSDDPDSGSKKVYYLVGYALMGSSKILFLGLSWIGIISVGVLAAKRLYETLLSSVLQSPMSFFDTTPLGRIVNRFSKDIDILDTQMSSTLNLWLNCLLTILNTVIVISLQTPLSLPAIILLVVVYMYFQKFYVKTSRQLKRLELTTRSPIYIHFSETLSGVSTIRAYGCQDRFIRESDRRIEINQQCLYPSAGALGWVLLRLELLSNMITYSAALFAVLAKGRISAGSVGLSLNYAVNISGSMDDFVRLSAVMENNMVSVERVDEYSEMKPETDWHSTNRTVVSDKWPAMGCIEFVDYSTRYRQGLDLVLKDINIKINAKEKIGIVGRTGSGKSSLSLGLFRIIESVVGKIVIDGIDISELALHDLRSGLTIIPQDPVLFAGTVRSNLDPFDRHSDSELWTALERSHLKHYVLSNESGLDFPVNEGGDNLSVGQRQLICLARALLRHTTVLILDEATAAIDVETDALIQTTIRSEFANCTVLTIAHRLNTILDSDRVLVLSDGRAVEFDSPLILLSDSNSLFYLLAKNAGIV
ncbi:multidrug resistance-associated protein 1-like isoform X2 [Oppia nitens]|uniref:multidrug resistance-associated protein 1-like isoform X2 n=1 Tax=Oppia nitens TaxID=1686743 RepID=UPI0023DBF79D|nr:multidrug resistance-associated protein 1-like isoform X2 [Oppia nitens]